MINIQDSLTRCKISSEVSILNIWSLKNMRSNGVEAAIARYRKAGTKKYAHNRNCAQRGSAYQGVLLYLKLWNEFIPL